MPSPTPPQGSSTLLEISTLSAASSEADAIDREIFPFFEEEAQQELRELETELHLLYANSDDAALALTDMRRQFHTLKGSANSVGHYRIGAIAHLMKVQVEQAIKSGVAGCPKDFSKLILDTIALIQKLLQEVRDPVHSMVPPGEVLRVAETIQAYPLPRRRPCARIHLP